MSTARNEIGPTVPPRWKVYQVAREIEELGRLARERATAGPRCDVAAAVKALERVRALLPAGDGDGV